MHVLSGLAMFPSSKFIHVSYSAQIPQRSTSKTQSRLAVVDHFASYRAKLVLAEILLKC